MNGRRQAQGMTPHLVPICTRHKEERKTLQIKSHAFQRRAEATAWVPLCHLQLQKHHRGQLDPAVNNPDFVYKIWMCAGPKQKDWPGVASTGSFCL